MAMVFSVVNNVQVRMEWGPLEQQHGQSNLSSNLSHSVLHSWM